MSADAPPEAPTDGSRLESPEATVDKVFDDARAEGGPRGAEERVTFGSVKRTAPGLYVVSVLVLLFGLTLMVSGPLSRALGASLLLFPAGFFDLGSALTFISGAALVVIAARLLRRERAAWLLAEFFLFFALLSGVISDSVIGALITIIVVLIMVYLWLHRDLFTNPRRYRTALQESIAFSALALVIIYGVLGSLYLSDIGGFDPPIDNTTDAIYFTIDTIGTVGSTGFHPVTPTAKWFQIGLMAMGITAFLGAAGVLVGPYIERRVKGVMGVLQRMQETNLKDHVVVCGRSDETDLLIDYLRETGQPYVVISRDREYLDSLREKGTVVVLGDPASEEVLLRANIEDARSLVAIHRDDAQNAFTTVTARGLRPDLFIIAMARSRENVPKLRKMGANNVVAPHVIVTRYIGRSAISAHREGEGEC
jgi:voltage-gated potassium channel